MDEDDYERVLSVKNEVFVYKIPPRQSSRGYRAADWKLDQPDWSGRLRIIEVNKKCLLKLEDKISGKLFAEAPVDQYPGPSVESVSDSSRYFVIKIVDNGPGKQHAFIGLGFADRGDSFDFNVTLQDHFKREKQEKITNESPNAQHLDLGFKEGETIKINFGNKGGQEAKAKLKKNSGNLGGILPPPPSGNAPRSIPAPSNSTVAVSQPVQQNKQSDADWGDFASFSNSSSTQQTSWVQF